jgi:hypothetical protein
MKLTKTQLEARIRDAQRRGDARSERHWRVVYNAEVGHEYQSPELEAEQPDPKETEAAK